MIVQISFVNGSAIPDVCRTAAFTASAFNYAYPSLFSIQGVFGHFSLLCTVLNGRFRQSIHHSFKTSEKRFLEVSKVISKSNCQKGGIHMVLGYMRVSTENQNLDLQRDALEKYGVDKIYSDIISGVKKRSELEQLLEVLREGDTLVVWKLDRLGRNTKQLLALIEGFDKRNIKFVSLTEDIDTSSPTGKFLVNVICSLAELERNILIMRTRAGLESAHSRGRFVGRPRTPDAKIEQALVLYDSRQYTAKQICDMVEISTSTLYRAVRERRENTKQFGGADK